MRTWIWFVAIVFVLGVGVASAQAPAGETLEHRIERLKAEEVKRIENETPRDRLIRLRAEEIMAEKARKEAEEKVKALDSSEMKQARKEVEKEEKEQKKAKERSFKAVNSVDLHGCDPEAVWVNPALGNNWGLRPSSIYSMVMVTIVNRYQQSTDVVSSLHGTLVKGLCSGGRVTITFAARSTTPSSMQIVLTAIGQSLGAGTQVDSRTISLWKSDYNSRQIQSQLWELLPR